MKLATAVFAAIAALACSQASADTIDLSTIKCKEFMAQSKEDIGYTLAWLDAYYKDDDAPAVIDTDKFLENAKKLGAYCGQHPDMGLITATDELFSK